MCRAGGDAGSQGSLRDRQVISSSVTVNGKNVLTCDGWAYDPVANRISLLKKELYFVVGDVLVKTEAGLWQVTLCGLPANQTLQVTGLDGLDSVRSDGNGKVAGLFLTASQVAGKVEKDDFQSKGIKTARGLARVR